VTAHSEYGYYTRFNAADYVAQEEPFDTGLARDMVNDVRHLFDVHGQVCVEWVTRTSSQYLEPATASTSAFQYIASFGPFPLRLREDGTPYALRVRLAGKSSQGNSVTFRAVVGAAEVLAGDVAASSSGLEGSTTSMASTWITTTNVVGGASSTLIALSVSSVPEMVRGESVAADTASSEFHEIRWALAHLQVWGKTSNVLSMPRLTGVYVAEYGG